MSKTLELSTLGKTWLLDLDGTLVEHNAYKLKGGDIWLAGAKEFLASIPQGDKIILLTSRTSEYRDVTVQFLKEHGIRYEAIIFDLPFGERILINDTKPSGLQTAVAVNTQRDVFCGTQVTSVL